MSDQDLPEARDGGGREVKPYQERVIKEKSELDDKLSRLRPFIGSPKFVELPDAEQQRLIKQAKLMELYSEVLAERIAAF